MKQVSAAYASLLFSGAPLLRADLLTITTANGVVMQYTSADIDLTLNGNTYSRALRWERDSTQQSIGTDADTIDLILYDDGQVLPGGVGIMSAVAQGLYNNAVVQIDKLLMPKWGDTSPGACGWFLGYVSTSKSQSGVATLTVKSMVGRLSVTMPRTIIQPQCNNAFGDKNCGFDVASVTFTGTCTGGTELAPTAALTDNQFNQGKIRFTSGANAGVVRSVRTNVGGVITLSYPLPNVPAAGDTFSISQSCLRTMAACQAYSNLAHFKGAPFVPVPETALEGGSTVSGSTGSTATISGSSTTAAQGAGSYAK